jgi:hypothetical protein
MPKDKQIPKQTKETNAINDLNSIPHFIKSVWITSSVKHSFPYEVSLPCVASFIRLLSNYVLGTWCLSVSSEACLQRSVSAVKRVFNRVCSPFRSFHALFLLLRHSDTLLHNSVELGSWNLVLGIWLQVAVKS